MITLTLDFWLLESSEFYTSIALIQDPYKRNETAEISSPSSKMKYSHQKESLKLEEVVSEKNQNNIVTSLAEKAMSVAGPVVPTKDDGEVDQERLIHVISD